MPRMDSLILFLLAASSLCCLLLLPPLVAGDNISITGLTSQKEVDAIKIIYEQWHVSDWESYINDNSDPCFIATPNGGDAWPFINCTVCLLGAASESCHITSLNLSSQGINAEIPQELFELQWLTNLDLSDNSISGPIPPEIGKLSNITYLNLSNNIISGSIPPAIGNLSDITYLDLSMNNFSGNISKEIANLSRLTYLNLSKNMLSGSVPSKLGDITSLNYLDLSVNMLAGYVPSELGKLRNLIVLKFSTNRFIGLLPQNMKNWTSLEKLYFDSSGVSGSLDVLEPLKKLKVLWAFDNDIDGKLTFIKDFRDLEELRIYGTLIGGPIPHFPNPASMQILYMSLKLGDLRIPSANSNFSFLANMDNLRILSLRDCSLTSNTFPTIPLLKNLIYLDLSFNNLNGTIPPMYAKTKFPKLTQLFIGGNTFDGSLDNIISGSNLTELDISFNPISGDLSLYPNVSINFLGTNIDAQALFSDSTSSDILNFIGNKSLHKNIRNVTINGSSFAIKCGANVDGISNLIYSYHNDSNHLGEADLNIDTDNQWVVSNVGSFLPNNNSMDSTMRTEHSISNGTENQILYQTARVSTSSLRYYIVGLPDGDDYKIEIVFAEIVIEEQSSWRGLGRRYFNIIIQGIEVERDFNIVDAAHGSYVVITKSYEHVIVKNRTIDIHFKWAGRGTCCIPQEYTYGPLVSAIRVSRGQPSPSLPSGKTAREKAGVAVGFFSLGIASLLISLSIMYLWWKWIRLNQVMKD